ncbi:hypothetical protein [Streptomyces angustmyceticus]|uniref:hypothetical protein n=1 Tax=Streptomyces angustmyceticus TaxID=285578 RepID=UPI00344E0DB4
MRTRTADGQFVRQWPPDFNTAGAVKRGEVEMGPLAVALTATRAAANLGSAPTHQSSSCTAPSTPPTDQHHDGCGS